MPFFSSAPLFRILPLAGAALLAACGGETAPDSTASAGVPEDAAIAGALNQSLATDTDLDGLSGADVVRPGTMIAGAGAAPQLVAGSPAAAAEARAAQAEALKAVGGRLDQVPRSGATGDPAPARPITLAAMAREPILNRGAQPSAEADGCTRSVTYGPQWAERLPVPFAVYPRASLTEAAGAANGRCDIVIASFVTPVAADQVVDYYYTLARRGGYDAEHKTGGGEQRLAGVRGKDGPAYLIFARKGESGLTEVDIVATIS